MSHDPEEATSRRFSQNSDHDSSSYSHSLPSSGVVPIGPPPLVATKSTTPDLGNNHPSTLPTFITTITTSHRTNKLADASAPPRSGNSLGGTKWRSSSVLTAVMSSDALEIPLSHPPSAVQPTATVTATPTTAASTTITVATGTPSTASNTADSKKPSMAPQLNLLHPLLQKIPVQVRFVCYGVLNSVLFMFAYNMAVASLDQKQYPPSRVYAITYLIFIPIGHAMASLLVFGWPERYIPSLMSNVPIALTAIALGSFLTAYLDEIKFNTQMKFFVKEYYHQPYYQMIEAQWDDDMDTHAGLSTLKEKLDDQDPEKGEFYSSMLVLLVTGIWTYFLSVLVNAASETSEKKEL